MKRLLLFVIIGLSVFKGYSQLITVKSNLLYDATSTLNLGLELGITPRITVDLAANYNPWSFSGESRLKHWMVQPEVRFWLYRKFDGHFMGLHGMYAEYDINRFGPLGWKNRGYEGSLYGGGISYGYQWLLSSRWNLEVTMGLGYIHFEYDKYDFRVADDPYLGKFSNTYYGPTKVGIALIYFFK